MVFSSQLAKKVIGATAITVILLNFILYLFKAYAEVVFWGVIIGVCITAFPILAILNKKLSPGQP